MNGPLVNPIMFQRNADLRPFATLRAGGRAELLIIVDSVDQLAEVVNLARANEWNIFVLGSGSNVLPSDKGVPGLVVINQASHITRNESGRVECDCGAALQDLFLWSVQRGYVELDYAVGIPGTVGGAIVSNAGAYRSNISEHLVEIEVVQDGVRKWVDPKVLQLSYRDSVLRHEPKPDLVLLRALFDFPKGDKKTAYDAAREFQRQRISKQPPAASAGSFFKNVVDRDLAASIEGLSDGQRANGVVPSGFLIEAVGLRGYRHGGAQFATKHANFIVNVGRATATEIRELAEMAKALVFDRFRVVLEEEVLFLGDWSEFEPKLLA